MAASDSLLRAHKPSFMHSWVTRLFSGAAWPVANAAQLLIEGVYLAFCHQGIYLNIRNYIIKDIIDIGFADAKK